MRETHRLWNGNACLSYTRVSKDVQDTSLPEQDREVARQREDFGLTALLARFEDDGERGHDEERPALQRLLQWVRAHPNPVATNADFIPVLVYDVSRFGRFDDPKKFVWYATEIERYGYEFYSVSDKIRSRGNIADFVQLLIKGQQAYDFTVGISRLGIRTGCALAQQGWWSGGLAPYGFDRMTYTPDGKPKYRYRTLPDRSVEKRTPDGTLVETIPPIEDKGRTRSAWGDKLKSDRVKLVPGAPELVATVRFIYAKFVTEGWGMHRIAKVLNAKAVRPARGGRWLVSAVRHVLTNPAYRGAIVYGRVSESKHHWLSIEKKGGSYETRIDRKEVPAQAYVHRTEDKCIVVEDGHEALIDKETWWKAARKFEARRQGHRGRSGRSVGSPYLLSGDGLMRCLHCGYRFQGDSDKRARTRKYVDAGYHMSGTGVCKNYRVTAEPLEAWVIEEIQRRLLDGRAAIFASREELERAMEGALAAGQESAKSNDHALMDSEKKIAAKEAKVAMLVENVSPENIALLDPHLSRLRQEIAALDAERRALAVATRATDVVTQNLKALAREAAGYLVNLKEVLATGSSDEKKRFIRDFVADILVDGEKREARVGFYRDTGAGEGKPLETLAALATRCAAGTPVGAAFPSGVPLSVTARPALERREARYRSMARRRLRTNASTSRAEPPRCTILRSALPTITPSATRATAAASAGVAIPKPTQSGRFVSRRTRLTNPATSPFSPAPVTPRIDTR